MTELSIHTSQPLNSLIFNNNLCLLIYRTGKISPEGSEFQPGLTESWTLDRLMMDYFSRTFSGHFCRNGRQKFLAYQIRFSMIFTNADKSYLAYPYPTCGIDKQVAQRAMIAHLSPMCQGQISFQKTYKWAMETNGNSYKLLCLTWLPATLMMIRSKMNELAWRHHFPIISLWEIF